MEKKMTDWEKVVDELVEVAVAERERLLTGRQVEDGAFLESFQRMRRVLYADQPWIKTLSCPSYVTALVLYPRNSKFNCRYELKIRFGPRLGAPHPIARYTEGGLMGKGGKWVLEFIMKAWLGQWLGLWNSDENQMDLVVWQHPVWALLKLTALAAGESEWGANEIADAGFTKYRMRIKEEKASI